MLCIYYSNTYKYIFGGKLLARDSICAFYSTVISNATRNEMWYTKMKQASIRNIKSNLLMGG